MSGSFLPAERVQSIAVIGGGAAAWLAAATLARLMKSSFCSVCVIAPPGSNAGSFSAAALPSFHRLNGVLGIDENDLVRKTRGTFKLGTEFLDWGRVGDRYFHAFGSYGAKLDAVPFHQCWLKARACDASVGSLGDFSTAVVAARQHRFAHASLDRSSVLSLYSYGYHFQADLLAAYLREYALQRGVIHLVRNIAAVQLRGEDGFVEALQLDDGSKLSADLFIDCEGIREQLFERGSYGRMHEERHRLPCDRAITMTCADTDGSAPYSQATAHSYGWRSLIPLQGSVDRIFAYSSHHLSGDEAAWMLRTELSGNPIAEPRVLQLSLGRPAKFWDKNYIVLSCGGFELLESTGLHRVQTAITRLMTLFPVRRISPNDAEEFNRLTTLEYERIRDFLLLHFRATQREDSPFWQECRHMEIPDSLRAKLELFQNAGRIAMFDEEHFSEDSWLALFVGQNLETHSYDPLADVLDIKDVQAAFLHMRAMINNGVERLPTHAQYIDRHCSAYGS
jgi:tryptophan 7-halogenase